MALSSRIIEEKRTSKECFISELNSLFGPIEEKQTDWSNTFHFSNDNEIHPQLVHLDRDKANTSISHESSIAMFIGNGYLPSLSPLIIADIILVCDIDHNLLNWMKFFITSYLASDNEEQFHEFLSNEKSPYHSTIGPYVKGYLRRDKEKLKEYYYFDEIYFKKCKSALASKEIVYIPLDFSNKSQMQKLKECFIKYRGAVSFMNLTNVWQWIVNDERTYFNYKESLLTLTYNDSPFILYSSNKGLCVGKLPTFRTMCRTIKGYIYCHAINESDDAILHDSQLLNIKGVPVINTVPLATPIEKNKFVVLPSLARQTLIAAANGSQQFFVKTPRGIEKFNYIDPASIRDKISSP